MARLPYPSIPVPKEDLKSILETVLTLKRAVELMTGQEATLHRVPHMFYQPDTPEAIHVGDLWLCNGMNYSLNIWNGAEWILITPVASNLSPAVTRSYFPQFKRPRP